MSIIVRSLIKSTSKKATSGDKDKISHFSKNKKIDNLTKYVENNNDVHYSNQKNVPMNKNKNNNIQQKNKQNMNDQQPTNTIEQLPADKFYEKYESNMIKSNRLIKLPEYYAFPSDKKNNMMELKENKIYYYNKTDVYDYENIYQNDKIKEASPEKSGSDIILYSSKDLNSCTSIFMIKQKSVYVANIKLNDKQDEDRLIKLLAMSMHALIHNPADPLLYIYLVPGFYCETEIKNIYKIVKNIVVKLIIKKKLEDKFYIVDEKELEKNLLVAYDLNDKEISRSPFVFHMEYLDDSKEYKKYTTLADKKRMEDFEKQKEFMDEKFKQVDTRQEEAKEQLKKFEEDTREQFTKTQDDISNSKEEIINNTDTKSEEVVGIVKSEHGVTRNKVNNVKSRMGAYHNNEMREIKNLYDQNEQNDEKIDELKEQIEELTEKQSEHTDELREQFEESKTQWEEERESLKEQAEEYKNKMEELMDKQKGGSDYYFKYKKYKSKYLKLRNNLLE
jgi:hypothetical protein